MTADSPTSRAVAAFLGAQLGGLDQTTVGIRPISDPQAAHLSFVTDPMTALDAVERALQIGAVLLYPSDAAPVDSRNGSVIVVSRPRAAFAAAVAEFFAPRPEAGIAASAVIHPLASVAETAIVGEFAVVGPGASVGAGTEIRHHCVIGRNVHVGDGCLVKSHAVLGEEGFGLESDAEGNNIRLPHLGSVVIGNHVEIGSFTSINAGTILPTVVEDYVKISDNVHVSHNCRIGRNSIVTGCVELSGSVTVGSDVWLAPNVSVREKISIGDGATVGIGAVVVRAVGPGEVHYGNPARMAPRQSEGQ